MGGSEKESPFFYFDLYEEKAGKKMAMASTVRTAGAGLAVMRVHCFAV